ncbi:MAG: hypothetical protein QOF68_2493 [Gaiellales bacterium]|nr:hypothetical protein [Gaiellales bacterium]
MRLRSAPRRSMNMSGTRSPRAVSRPWPRGGPFSVHSRLKRWSEVVSGMPISRLARLVCTKRARSSRGCGSQRGRRRGLRLAPRCGIRARGAPRGSPRHLAGLQAPSRRLRETRGCRRSLRRGSVRIAGRSAMRGRQGFRWIRPGRSSSQPSYPRTCVRSSDVPRASLWTLG